MVQKILAPLRGFTDSVFRTVWATHFTGLDYAVAPFIATSRGQKIDKLLKDLDPEKNKKLPVVPQILGNDADQFVFFANELFDRGYFVVNWNLGCPFSAVVKKKKGAGLLQDPDRIAVFLEEVLPRVKGAVSIKMRLGWESVSEFPFLLQKITSFPVETITVHARTGKQGYSGTVAMEPFLETLNYPHIKWIYNGDITSPNAFEKIFAFPNIHLEGVMLGRGVLENPFLPERIAHQNEAEIENCRRRFSLFHEELLSEYEKKFDGPGHLLDHMKGFWSYFAKGFANSRKITKEIYKTRQVSQFQSVVKEIIEGRETPSWGV